ncbi:MAG TPA: DUF6036 family nucleotidyltransferase [Thermoanaerobaculia bacterium]|jgi:hypothetical protein|nr:DUF6036 family nucleotidyltransferase [Thermoanaerobaculia bacterium]
MVNQDFRDLFAEFNARHVDFLVVGAYALAVHGHVRATKDLDVWVRPHAENARRVFHALQAFGAPTGDLTQDDFAQPGLTFQIGVAPIRIDVLSSIDGVEFDAAWPNRIEMKYGDQRAYVISRNDLLTNKRAAARLQDLADVEALEALNPAEPQ